MSQSSRPAVSGSSSSSSVSSSPSTISISMSGFRFLLRRLCRCFGGSGVVLCRGIGLGRRAFLRAGAGSTVGLAAHHFLQLVHGLELGLMINLFFTLLLKQNQGSRCTSGTGQTGQQQTRFQLGRIFHGIHFLSKGDAARRRVEREKRSQPPCYYIRMVYIFNLPYRAVKVNHSKRGTRGKFCHKSAERQKGQPKPSPKNVFTLPLLRRP